MVSELAGQKKAKLHELLEEGIVMIHLDPRRPGVVVPEHLAADPVLRLNVAWGFRLPAFDIGDEDVYAVLSFGGRDFGCTLPWAAIFAMTLPDTGHRGAVWPTSLPPELLSQADALVEAMGEAEGAVERVSIVGEAKAQSARPGLRVVQAESALEEPAPEDPASSEPNGEQDDEEVASALAPSRSHLRLVK